MLGVYTMSKYTMTIKSICDMMDSVGKLKSFDELSKYWMNTIETSLSDPSKDFILCFSNGCCRK